MRHYEVVYLIRVDQGEQVPQIIEHYQQLVGNKSGKIHRLEDWGRRQLAYPIQDERKAYYVLMNIECDQETVSDLKDAFKFNDAIIRSLVIRRDSAIVEPSLLVKKDKEKTDSVKE